LGKEFFNVKLGFRGWERRVNDYLAGVTEARVS
jgi:hypothetical protein